MTTESISKSVSSDEPKEQTRVTTGEARDRLEDALFSALEAGKNTLIDAPTSLGKTYQIATTRWRDYPEVTGGNPVIHIHQTKEARDDAIRQSENEPGVECCVLHGRTDTCPVAAGDYDDELTAPDGLCPSDWFDWMCNVRNNTFQKAHRTLGQQCDLPCEPYCDAVTQWWGIANDDDEEPEYDVLHTTANFAHVDDLIEGANIIYDERPEYGLTFSDPERMQFQRSITNLLEHRSDDELAMLDLRYAVVRGDTKKQSLLAPYFEEEITSELLFTRKETHRLAPSIGRALLDAEERCADRYYGQDGQVEVVMASDGEIRHVQHTPDLSEARCVVGLDAFPSEMRWRVNTVDDLSLVKPLYRGERKWWRRNERGLVVKQIGDDTRSYTNGWGRGAGESRGKAVIQKIRTLHGEEFQSCIAPDSVEDDVTRMMAGASIEEPMTMHYGEQKSRNDFSDESVGTILGCIDPGDESILDFLALCGKIAQPKHIVTESGETKRETNRGFVGPDADVAMEFLASVRENNLAQAVGRYARNPDDPNSGATVYVWSDAIPQQLVDEKIETNYRRATKKRKEFVRVLKRNPSGCTPKIISDETGSDKSYIIDWLDEMERQNNVTKSAGTGYQGATEWEWCGGEFGMFVVFGL
ncbi:hypothetical protein [Halolamina sediminis]|uniref:hypothetical protein n=1 Tax=Halolamina sediminis TaxID=1480675 RepID=UPI0009AEDDD4|nr:hypothetical protein [Halolamina sediminis]